MLKNLFQKTNLVLAILMVNAGTSIVVAGEAHMAQWTSPTSEGLTSVFMVDCNDGWAVGDYGTIIARAL